MPTIPTEEFDFDAFRQKVNSASDQPRCTWSVVSDQTNAPHACDQPIPPDSTNPLLKWLLNHETVSSLYDIPSSYYSNAFCDFHHDIALAVKAGPSSRTSFKPEQDEGLSRCDVKSLSTPKFGSLDGSPSLSDFKFDPLRLNNHSTLSWEGYQSGLRSEVSTERHLLIDRKKQDNEGVRFKKILKTPRPVSDEHMDIQDIASQAVEPRRSTTPVDFRPDDAEIASADKPAKPSSLSPDNIRNFSRGKSSRTRSPSVPFETLDRRSRIAFDSMRGHTSRDLPVEYNANAVVALVKLPVNVLDGDPVKAGGWVYAFRDPALGLTKIGMSDVHIDSRRKRIKSVCKIGETFTVVGDPHTPRLREYKRLERLVQEDLAPHRWYFKCECGLKAGKGALKEHREYYLISDELVIRTIQLWTDFLNQNPYGKLETTGLHQLQDSWRELLEDRVSVPENETHEDHEKRLSRWRRLFCSHVGQYNTAVPSLVPDAADDVFTVLKTEADPELDSTNDHFRIDAVPSIEEPEQELQPQQVGGSALDANAQNPGEADVKSSVPHSADGSLMIWPEQLATSTHATGNDVSAHGDGEASEIPNAFAEGLDLPSRGLDGAGPPDTAVADVKSDNPDESPLNQDLILDISAVLQQANKALCELRDGLPLRSIYVDLIKFRWPLVCSVMLVVHAPYCPPFLSFLTWLVFFPSFVAELREWFPVEPLVKSLLKDGERRMA